MEIIQKVYPIIAGDHQTLYDFISGSALIPYLDRLEGVEKQLFITAYRERIAKHFPRLPAMYAFKRLLLYGVKQDKSQ
jgi:trans-aconitate 2-methyltransferase